MQASPPATDQALAVPVASSAAAWLLYLLECSGNRLYAGITNNFERRMLQHITGTGARFTRAFPPEALVGTLACNDRSSALKAEAAIRRLAPAQKRAFVVPEGAPLEAAAPRVPDAESSDMKIHQVREVGTNSTQLINAHDAMHAVAEAAGCHWSLVCSPIWESLDKARWAGRPVVRRVVESCYMPRDDSGRQWVVTYPQEQCPEVPARPRHRGG